MELMSSMLLCALVALLPQTLGKSEYNSNVVIKRSHKANRNPPNTMILNMKGAYTNEYSDLHSVYEDIDCQKCHMCMDRAIKAQYNFAHVTKFRPSAKELQDDLLDNKIVVERFKRDVETIEPNRKTEHEKKLTKTKPAKTASVTKYDFRGDVYALKVKDINESGSRKDDDVCRIYSIKKSISCKSPEKETLLIEARRNSKKTKLNKTEPIRPKLHINKAKYYTSKIPETTTTEITAENIPETNSLFKKREMDNSEVPEFNPSIEEMTY